MKLKLSYTSIIVLFVLLFSTCYANYISYNAPIMHVEVENINEDIKSIWLCIYDEFANVTDAYKNSSMDFSKANFLEAFPKEEYKYCATIHEEVEPFTKEDYKFNTNYDTKNYIADLSISYDYITGSGGFGTHEKYNSLDEFIEKSGYFNIYSFDEAYAKASDAEKAMLTPELIEYYKKESDELNEFVKEEIEKVKSSPITCERTIFYSVKRLIEQKEIPVKDIKNKTLTFNIEDFSDLNKYRQDDINAGYALRFENSKGKYTTLIIGHNEMHQDSYSKQNIKTYNLKKNIKLDYGNRKTLENNSYISQEEAKELSKFNFEKNSWSKASDWAEEELNEAKEKDLIPPIFSGADLTKNITRKELAHIAIRLYEIIVDTDYNTKISNPFKDTTDEEVIKAYSLGITQGTSEYEFSPDKLITREQLATMMTRLLEKTDIYTYIVLNNVNKFTDDAKMSSWAKSSIYFMSENEIIKGIGNNQYGPTSNASIEQSILIAKRINDNYKSMKEKSVKATTPEDVGNINTNYAKDFENVTAQYRETGTGIKLDLAEVEEIQVFTKESYYGYNVYYSSNESDVIDYLYNHRNSIKGMKYYCTYVLKDNRIINDSIFIDAEYLNTKMKFHPITISNSAKIGASSNNPFKDWNYSVEEEAKIISILQKIKPVKQGYGAYVSSVDMTDGYIWIYQYENTKPIAYYYRIDENQELNSILDEINLRKLKELIKRSDLKLEIYNSEVFMDNDYYQKNTSKQQNEIKAKLYDYIINNYVSTYPTENYYTFWISDSSYNNFVYVKIPNNDKTNAYFEEIGLIETPKTVEEYEKNEIDLNNLVGKTGKVIVDLVNVRSATSSNGVVLASLEKNEEFEVIRISSDKKWLFIEFNSRGGWIKYSKEFYEFENEEEKISEYEKMKNKSFDERIAVVLSSINLLDEYDIKSLGYNSNEHFIGNAIIKKVNDFYVLDVSIESSLLLDNSEIERYITEAKNNGSYYNKNANITFFKDNDTLVKTINNAFSTQDTLNDLLYGHFNENDNLIFVKDGDEKYGGKVSVLVPTPKDSNKFVVVNIENVWTPDVLATVEKSIDVVLLPNDIITTGKYGDITVKEYYEKESTRLNRAKINLGSSMAEDGYPNAIEFINRKIVENYRTGGGR